MQVRSVHMDVARGMAVFGIFLVNIWSFVWGFEYLRYGMLPVPPSFVDQGVVFAVALFAEQKFYPIFAFLFGAGFAIQTRSLKRLSTSWSQVQTRYRRRLAWLLGLGILHGTLIWGGDVLTVYGLAGFLILSLAGARLARVRIHLWCWMVLWVLMMVLNVVVSLAAYDDTMRGAQGGALLADVQATHAVYTQGTLVAQLWQRLGDYASVTLSSIVLIPHLVVLFILGILSVRLGWITSPWRHAGLWRRVRVIGYAIGIPFNLVWASVALAEAVNPVGTYRYGLTVYAFLPLGGSLLAAAYLASIMLAPPTKLAGIADWLAPVGRMSLTNYLTQSVLGVILLQGVGLGLGKAAAASPALLMAIVAVVAVLQIFFSRAWLARHSHGPMEALYRPGKVFVADKAATA